jgi:hypothetical protein
MKGRVLVKAAAAAGLGLSLAACGGGSVSSTPAPTPTPTPTPTPPPPTNLKLTELSGDRTFNTAGVKYDVGTAGASNFASLPYPNGVQVAYSAANDSYTLSIPGATATTFLPSEVTQPQPAPNVVQYLKRNSSGAVTDVLTLIIPTSGGVPLNYTLVGTWGTNVASGTPTYRIGIGGIPTLASDVPKTGSANYSVGVGGSANNNGTNYNLQPNSTATFSANFAAGTVATTLNLSGVTGSGATPVSFGSFTGTGTIASTTPGFTGTFSGTAFNSSATSGFFSGAFFGPQGIEMGYAYALSAGTFNAVGAVTGAKQ